MLEFHEEAVTGLAWEPGGERLASGDEIGCVAVWHPERGQAPLAADHHPAAVTALSWSRTGGVFSARADGTIVRFDAE